MPVLTTLYSLLEVCQHNAQDDCWIVIDRKVYDVSSYMNEHPGGDDLFLDSTGKDAANDFEGAGHHSKEAQELMDRFCIGELDDDGSFPKIPELEISSEKKKKKKRQQPSSYAEKLRDFTEKYWTLPMALVAVSVIASFLYLRRT